VIVVLPLAAAGLIYGFWSAPHRRLTQLGAADLQRLSPYLVSAKKFEGKGQKNFTLIFGPKWDELAPEEQEREIKALAEKLQSLQTHHAEFLGGRGLYAEYNEGRLRFPPVFKGKVNNKTE
jgi:hypothetical protein